MKSLYYAIACTIAVLIGAVAVGSDTAGAVSGSCYFTATNSYVSGTTGCSIDGYGSYATNDVFTGRNGSTGAGQAMPESAVDSKEQFISYIVGRFNGSNVQNKVGAAFVIQKMRGSRAWPDAAAVADWQNRMRDPAVRFHSLSKQLSSSSWYHPGNRNVFTASRSEYQSIVEIRHNGQTLVEVVRDCGNPTAQGSTLPVARAWSISPESRLHAPSMPGTNGQWGDASNRPAQTVTVGNNITFWHKLDNTGNKDVSKLETYVQSYRQLVINPSIAQSTTNSPTTYGTSWNTTPMESKSIGMGGTVYYHPTYTLEEGAATLSRQAQVADVGNFVCQRIATQSAEGSSAWRYSAPACVKVVAPPVPSWSVGGVSGINRAEALPSDTVRWTHRLSLTGGPTNAGISRSIVKSDGWSGTESLSAIGQPWSLATRSSPYENVRTHSVTQDDVGKRLCQNIRWSPRSISNAAANSSAAACVVVPYDFDLTPSLSTSASYAGGAVEANATVRIDRTVSNGGRTKSRNAEWQMVEFVVRQGSAIPRDGGGTGAQNPCSWFGPTATGCASIDGGTDRVFTTGLTSLTPPSERDVPDLDVGDRICWGLSVRTYSHSSPAGDWRHAQPYCLTVGKKPKVQFWGADVRSSGAVTTATSTVNGNMYGSWAEYAVISARQVVSSSGAGLSSNEGGLSSMPNAFSYNKLTFSNTSSPFGNFTTTPSDAPSRPAGLEVRAAPSLMNVGDEALVSGVYESTGDIEIGGGSLSKSKVVYVETTGTVRITGDVTYGDATYSTAEDLPQLVIKARNIIIEEGVRRVDAWLVATSGYVSTCGSLPGSAWTSGLSSNRCNEQLIVNGPIMSERLYLRRTHGADVSHRGRPAEILNLRPDAYLWGKASASKSTSIGTQHLKELPPRF